MRFFELSRQPSPSPEEMKRKKLDGIQKSMKELADPDKIIELARDLALDDKEERNLVVDLYERALNLAEKNTAKQLQIARHALEKEGAAIAIPLFGFLRHKEPNDPDVQEGYADATIQRTREMLHEYMHDQPHMRYVGNPAEYASFLRADIPDAKKEYGIALEIYRSAPAKLGGYRDNGRTGTKSPRVSIIEGKIADLAKLQQEINEMEQSPAVWDTRFKEVDRWLDEIQAKIHTEKHHHSSSGLDIPLEECVQAKKRFMAYENQTQEVKEVIRHMEERIERIIALKERLRAEMN